MYILPANYFSYHFFISKSSSHIVKKKSAQVQERTFKSQLLRNYILPVESQNQLIKQKSSSWSNENLCVMSYHRSAYRIVIVTCRYTKIFSRQLLGNPRLRFHHIVVEAFIIRNEKIRNCRVSSLTNIKRRRVDYFCMCVCIAWLPANNDKKALKTHNLSLALNSLRNIVIFVFVYHSLSRAQLKYNDCQKIYVGMSVWDGLNASYTFDLSRIPIVKDDILPKL